MDVPISTETVSIFNDFLSIGKINKGFMLYELLLWHELLFRWH